MFFRHPRAVLTLTLGIGGLAACSDSTDGGSNAPTAGNNGASGAASGSGGSVASAGSGGTAPTAGMSASSAGSSTAGGAGAGGGAAPGVAGAGGSASGSAGASSMAGAAGMVSNGGGGGAGGGAGGGGSAGGGAGGGSAGGGVGGGSPGAGCPMDKTFCAGFEDAMLPAGAVYKVNAAPGEWTRDFEIDSTVAKSGKSSLKLKSPSGSGSAYQMLAVPAPTGKFWARFYIRQASADIGIVDHNVFAGASDSSEPNGSVMIEFAEDVGVSLNTSDDVRWPAGFGRIGGDTKPFTLAKGEWHCIEISFDSVARAQQVYVNGVLKIDATDYPKTVAKPVAFFKFGFNSLHGPQRSVWYDDVAVGPTRPGCL